MRPEFGIHRVRFTRGILTKTLNGKKQDFNFRPEWTGNRFIQGPVYLGLTVYRLLISINGICKKYR